jgi:hypothetical protein
MTTTLTIRVAREKKRRIAQQAKPNVNAWINRLIDTALEGRDADWPSHFDRVRRHGRRIAGHPADELRAIDRRR